MPTPEPPRPYQTPYSLPARSLGGAAAPLVTSVPPPAPSLAVPVDARGWVEIGLDALKNAAPELLVNYVVTKGNYTPVARQIQQLTKAPASFFLTLITGFVALATRGQGWVGKNSVTVAKGSGHATVSEIARPKATTPATPQPAGVDESDQLDQHGPTES